MTPRLVRNRLELLESREVLSSTASFFDGTALTVDFAPDNSSVYGTNSNFYAKFDSAANGDQYEILRAFQTWANVANLNFGLLQGNGREIAFKSLEIRRIRQVELLRDDK